MSNPIVRISVQFVDIVCGFRTGSYYFGYHCVLVCTCVCLCRLRIVR